MGKILAWISRVGMDSVFFSQICWCLFGRSRCDISWLCFFNFMFLHYCVRIAVAGGKMEIVLSINWISVTCSPHNRSFAVIRWSFELEVTKSGKSSTRRLIQSFLAWGRNIVCSWWNLVRSWSHKLAGSSTCMYYNMSDGYKCLRRTSKVCHFMTTESPSAVSADR